MRQPQVRTVLIGTGAAIAVVAGGTAAYAVTYSPISSGVIHGCYGPANSAGSHKLVLQETTKACPAGTTAIKWNQKGPAGPQGPQGPQGAQGAQGPRGPSNAYLASNDDVANAGAGSFATVDSLSLSTGSYAVTAKVVPYEDGAPDDTIVCNLVAPDGTVVDQAYAALNNTSSGFTDQTVSLESTMVTSGGTASVQCLDDTGLATWFREKIMAIKVDTATPPAARIAHTAQVRHSTRP